MNFRKIISGLGLILCIAIIASQSNLDAAQDKDTKANKKALKKKLLEKKAENKTESKPADKSENLKPAPSDVSRPNAPAHPMPIVELAKLIDQSVERGLIANKIEPSKLSSDSEFLRRVYLDITGVIPTAEQAANFLDDRSPEKRSKLIDQLLESKEYGKHMADIWTGLMYPVDSENRFLTKAPLREWLTEQFNANTHWDGMAYDLIAATGEHEKNGATVYTMANRGVDKLTDSVGKLFLGVQIQCAQCHNHPFTGWKQNEYWGLAQFFYKVNVSNPRAAKDGGSITVSETNRPNRKINELPESAKTVSAKFLGGDAIKLNANEPYRPVLAKWICSPTNPFFAKAFVNRVWSQYFGKGIVNPVDDLSEENTPSHPELLIAISKEFGNSGFDIKHLIRGICNSNTYQRTSKPFGDNRDDHTMFSHQSIKVLTPEQMFDSLEKVLGTIGRANVPPPKGKGPPPSTRDQFATFFMGTDNAKPTDYEAGIPQALRLMNNPIMASTRLTNVAVKIGDIAKGKQSTESVIEKLYLSTLSRRPTKEETKKLSDFVAKASDSKAAYGDVLWVLLNSSEFALNR